MATEAGRSPPSATFTTSSLIFPLAAQSFSKTLTSLKYSTLSIPNRLNSIDHDAGFVVSVANQLDLPLVANERCGSWYIPPTHKSGSAYFKSTDGHTGQWKFSTRRLNLQILDAIGKNDGRGKSMPDALSKTVPIWCVVLNKVLFPLSGEAHVLKTPEDAVSRSEHAQIEERLDGLARDLQALELDITSIRSKVQKPLEPHWTTQDSGLVSIQRNPAFHSIICCTASRRVEGTEASEGGYIQGAGDDSEGWSHGLTPTMFWDNHDILMEANESDLPSLIEELVVTSRNSSGTGISVDVSPAASLFIGALSTVEEQQFDCVVACCDVNPFTKSETSSTKSSFTIMEGKWRLFLPCALGKAGSKALRSHLPHLATFFDDFISKCSKRTLPRIICIDQSNGLDLAVGIALVLACVYFDDDGTLLTTSPEKQSCSKRKEYDKLFIRKRLTWITTSHSSANPSRATLRAVNSFLMGRPS
ncbi:hypothetical protein MMC25_000586 [Agyrium rufum]|nr:hypothetical protein [Agyrium rufum]